MTHQHQISRRHFIGTTGTAALAAGTLGTLGTMDSMAAADETVSAAHLPRWRGFNLLEKFNGEYQHPFVESDFAWMAEWGFDFVRLPLSYRCWADSDPAKWLEIKESVLKDIDQVVDWGKQYKIHVNINFHRAPGYCVNPPAEPLSLWKDEKALEASAYHWAHFAKRYKGIPSQRVSFDLLNEPGDYPEADYLRVVKRLVEAIRAEDPNRLIIADGLKWGTSPVTSLAPLGIGQSTRGYEPMRISHYKASWIGGSDKWEEPTWPLKLKEGDVVDKERLRRERIKPWQALQKLGVGVHVGEWGAFNRTPHAVAMAWMKDFLSLWKEAGWGWSLWNLRGSFGVVDSDRPGVTYEDFHGHKLDRAMLELLRQEG